MRTFGDFYHTPEGDAFFFDQSEGRVLPIGSSALANGIYARFGINPADRLFKIVEAHLYATAFNTGHLAEIRHLAYYEQHQGILYVHSSGKHVYRLDGSSTTRVTNGTDGVFFVSQSWEEEFEPSTPKDLLGPLVFERPNFAPTKGLSAGDQRFVFCMCCLSMFFESEQPTKPILLFQGPAGSGKGTSTKLWGVLLFGSNFDVTPLRREKEDAFDAAVTNNSFVIFDNVDARIPWLEDKLAATATGQAIRLRRLYTTNEEALYWPRCFVALTSRTPQFRRPDVADRLIPHTLERPSEFIPESVLLGEVLEHRNELWAELLETLNQIVSILQTSKQHYSGGLRMADWADFAMRIGDGLGVAAEVERVLVGIQQEQHEFAVEEDFAIKILRDWVTHNNAGRWLTARELNEELRKFSVWRGYAIWPYTNPRALAQHFDSIWEALEREFKAIRIPGAGGAYRYTFQAGSTIGTMDSP